MTPLVPDPAKGRNTLSTTIAGVVPEALRNLKRWTGWTWIPPRREGAKPGKKPLSLTNDQATWLTFGEALKLAAAGHAGVGFQMMGCSTLAGIDLDGCVDLDTGVLSDFAGKLLAALPDTYAEVTPSGKGLRIFAGVPDGMVVPEFLAHKHGVECYVGRSARFLTVTGRCLPGREGKLADLTPEAHRLLASISSASGGELELEVPLPVPRSERVGEWRKLFDERLPYKRLNEEWRDYLEHGDVPGGRSERTFAVACRMIETRYHPEEIFVVLSSAPGSWEAALDKRDQDPTRARALIWSDIGRAQKIVRSDQSAKASAADEWSKLGLKVEIRQKVLQVVRSQMNGLRVLTAHPAWQGRFALDVTTGLVLLDSTPLDDARLFAAQEQITEFCKWAPDSNRQWWTDMIRAAANTNPINPREAYLRSLKWDGSQRLDSWFTDHVAAEDNELNRTLGKKWLLSCVQRWLVPGCKCDTVLILQGVEGARKNTFFETLAGGVDRVVGIDGMERDDKMTVARAWIAEMPEAALFRRADRNRLKGFITNPVDQYRPPYASSPVAVKRAFVLVSTSNTADLFHADQDGLRRFWPVEVRSRIDYEWVAEHREQLLAEAVAYLDMADVLGDASPWWFDTTPTALRERVNQALEASSLDDAIVRLVATQAGKGGLTLSEVIQELTLILGTRPHDRQVSPLLEKHGVRRSRSKDFRFWCHPSWARACDKREADVIPLARPLKAIPVAKDEQVEP